MTTYADRAAPERKQRKLSLHVGRAYGQVWYATPEGDIIRIPTLSGGAGSFPDAPSRRMAWEADGTINMWRNVTTGAVMQEFSGGNQTEANDEDNVVYSSLDPASGSAKGFHIVYIFPELREFDGFMGAQGAAGGTTGGTTRGVFTSADTTNGISGTFISRLASYSAVFQPYPNNYRDSISSVAVSSIRAVRWQFNSQNNQDWRDQVATHIYGEISAGETPDRLLWFNNDDDLEFSKPIDYGDQPRGSASDQITYLKNNSASLSANSVQVTAEDLYLGSGAWYTFDDGTGFSATKALASSIANGADSPDITIRRIIPDSALVGLHAARAYVSHASFT